MFSIRVIVPFFFYALHLVLAVFNNKYAGPFDIIIKQIADCEHPERFPMKWVGNKMSKHNRTTFLYSTNVTVPDTLDDNTKVMVRAAVFGNGGWRDNFFVGELGGLCTVIRNVVPNMLDVLKEHLNQTCPINPGNYIVKNVVLNIKVVWPSLPYNSYRADISYKRYGMDYMCKRIYADVVPKKN